METTLVSERPAPAGSEARHTLSSPEAWVDLHGDYLYRYALPRVRDPHLAEDITQETFLAALDARKSFSGRSTERTWLTGILRHKLCDVYRKRSRETLTDDVEARADPTDGLFDDRGHWIRPPQWTPEPEKAFENKAFRLALGGCIDKLPRRLADAFTLREMEHLPSKEVCKVLDISSTNLWVMLHRARMRLRSCLETKWFGADEV